MSDAPVRIWLQIGDDSDGMECTYDEAVKAGADISWCAEQIFDCDIEYISADEHSRICDKLATALEDKYDQQIESLQRTVEELEQREKVQQNNLDAAADMLERRDERIANLQRTNEELKRENDDLRNPVIEKCPPDLDPKKDCPVCFAKPDGVCRQGFPGFVLTPPEMRERIEAWLEDTAPPKEIDYVAATLRARVVFHDLLKCLGDR